MIDDYDWQWLVLQWMIILINMIDHDYYDWWFIMMIAIDDYYD